VCVKFKPVNEEHFIGALSKMYKQPIEDFPYLEGQCGGIIIDAPEPSSQPDEYDYGVEEY